MGLIELVIVGDIFRPLVIDKCMGFNSLGIVKGMLCITSVIDKRARFNELDIVEGML